MYKLPIRFKDIDIKRVEVTPSDTIQLIIYVDNNAICRDHDDTSISKIYFKQHELERMLAAIKERKLTQILLGE